MNDIKDTITPRQLREILYYVRNQNMTVRELRSALFDAVHQNDPVAIRHGMFEEMLSNDEDSNLYPEEQQYCDEVAAILARQSQTTHSPGHLDKRRPGRQSPTGD